MNAHDLLAAFQAVDPAFLDEAAAREHGIPKQTVRQSAASIWEKKEVNMSNNKLWQGLMGAAAAVAVFSIAAAGFAAVKPNSNLVADHPAESAGTDALTDPAAFDETETTTKTTDLQLPSDDFFEVTEPSQEYTPEWYDWQSQIEFYYKSDLAHISIYEEHSAPWEPLKLNEAGENMHILLTLRRIQSLESGADHIKCRIVLMQDGELMPFSFEEDGAPAIWQDTEIPVDYFAETTLDIWLTPKHQSEYSLLNAVVICDPEPGAQVDADHFWGKGNVYFADVVLHTDTPEQSDETDLPYAFASAEDYTAFPEALRTDFYAYNTWDGIGIGRRMDYQANWPNRYAIRSNAHNEATVLSRDEVYLKLHLHGDVFEEVALPRGDGTSYQPVLDGIYLMVLCDGKPISAFDGKSVLYIDTPDGTDTLNYRISIDDSVTDGAHYFAAIAWGKWHNPLERAERIYYLQDFESTPIIIE